MRVIFTDTVNPEHSGGPLFRAGDFVNCSKIEADPENPRTYILLTLTGYLEPIRIEGRLVRVFTGEIQPDFSADVWFVPHGYQADFCTPKHVTSECRDFGGTHSIEALTSWIRSHFDGLLAQMRKEH